MRNYEYHDINEMGRASLFIDGKPHKRFEYENKILANTDAVLIGNFNKVAKWIEDNCPSLNGKFECRHNPYHWVRLVLEDGKAYLEYGSHGYGFDVAMSQTETAVFSRGSMQKNPYAFKGIQFARNDRLEEFLRQWETIKLRIIGEYKAKKNVYSNTFEP